MAELRPGFNLDCTFKEHLSPIRGVLRNSNNGQFISYDDKTLKVSGGVCQSGSHERRSASSVVALTP